MIHLRCNVHSYALGLATSFEALLPEARSWPRPPASARGPARHPVLYLLHGLSDDDTIWQRRTALERYAESLPFAIIMPNGYRGFYTDTAAGARHWTFLSEELPALVQALLPVSGAREDTFAAGLSMGGYGAFKLALRGPDRFAAAASLSGALDVVRFARAMPSDAAADMRAIFGDPDGLAGGPDDLFQAARAAAAGAGPRPKLWQACGSDDYLYEDNRRFRDHALALGLDLAWIEAPGAHTWDFWDRHIQAALAWLAGLRGAS